MQMQTAIIPRFERPADSGVDEPRKRILQQKFDYAFSLRSRAPEKPIARVFQFFLATRLLPDLEIGMSRHRRSRDRAALKRRAVEVRSR